MASASLVTETSPSLRGRLSLLIVNFAAMPESSPLFGKIVTSVCVPSSDGVAVNTHRSPCTEIGWALDRLGKRVSARELRAAERITLVMNDSLNFIQAS